MTAADLIHTGIAGPLITAFLNYESPELLGVSRISQDLEASTIVDNIILLNHVEFSNRLRRTITVPKARGTAPKRTTREYTTQRGGITLAPTTDEDQMIESVPQLPFASYYGVLACSPARRSPVIEEHLVTGKELPVVEGASGAGEKVGNRGRQRRRSEQRDGKSRKGSNRGSGKRSK